MWGVLKTRQYERRLKQYEKKKNKKPQLAAVLNNLEIFQKSLMAGKKPKPFVYGFLRTEPSDVIAITEQGGGANIAATRLYVYPDTETETLYLLTLGDKSTQSDDIRDCKDFVKQIRANPNTGDSNDHDSDHDEERGECDG